MRNVLNEIAELTMMREAVSKLEKEVSMKTNELQDDIKNQRATTGDPCWDYSAVSGDLSGGLGLLLRLLDFDVAKHLGQMALLTFERKEPMMHHMLPSDEPMITIRGFILAVLSSAELQLDVKAHRCKLPAERHVLCSDFRSLQLIEGDVDLGTVLFDSSVPKTEQRLHIRLHQVLHDDNAELIIGDEHVKAWFDKGHGYIYVELFERAKAMLTEALVKGRSDPVND